MQQWYSIFVWYLFYFRHLNLHSLKVISNKIRLKFLKIYLKTSTFFDIVMAANNHQNNWKKKWFSNVIELRTISKSVQNSNKLIKQHRTLEILFKQYIIDFYLWCLWLKLHSVIIKFVSHVFFLVLNCSNIVFFFFCYRYYYIGVVNLFCMPNYFLSEYFSIWFCQCNGKYEHKFVYMFPYLWT